MVGTNADNDFSIGPEFHSRDMSIGVALKQASIRLTTTLVMSLVWSSVQGMQAATQC